MHTLLDVARMARPEKMERTKNSTKGGIRLFELPYDDYKHWKRRFSQTKTLNEVYREMCSQYSAFNSLTGAKKVYNRAQDQWG